MVFAVDLDRAMQNNAADTACQLEKGDSVWALWAPLFSGRYDFRTNASKSIYNYSFLIQIAIYEGDSCETSKQVACSFGSIDGFSVRTGTMYFIITMEAQFSWISTRVLLLRLVWDSFVNCFCGFVYFCSGSKCFNT
jgi:hypothetical protein